MEYIKNAFNYQGGKDKLLEQIIPLFPKNIDTFVDLFCGSGVVALNVDANKRICYDKNAQLIDILNNIDLSFYNNVLKIIEQYKLDKTNRGGYLQLREDYNSMDNCRMKSEYLYTLICHSFNNQFSFNKSGGMNVPFGKDRSSFNPSLQNKFLQYVSKLQEIDIEFICKDFKDVDLSNLTSSDLVYVDCPYLITVGGYERDYRLKWNEENEISLLNKLEELNSNNIKFALSNVLEHKGKINSILSEWCKKYNTHFLSKDYGNCNYQTHKREDKKSVEVLITNY